ncbi:NDR1/HIN1-like protein 2 [Cajanus cajan]|uniref:NDR1/HIN1-like protein 2 n=1 Tax=Cajanus cajan TaxID=3821 RepID=UPI00098DCDC8|nr:NDR1/HIN1-like protein 2 [Cajanus cajan]
MPILYKFIIWIITDPSNIKFYVTHASFTQFNLTTNNTLYYNLKVNITVRSPNKHTIVHYKEIKAKAWYKDNGFGKVNLTPFDQGHNNTTFPKVVFEGHNVIRLKPKQLGEYKEETSARVYDDLAVGLDLTITTKIVGIDSTNWKPILLLTSCTSLKIVLDGYTAINVQF